MAGRPPKPARIRLLEGNRSRTEIPHAPEPADGLPTRPGILSPEARREWRRLLDSLPPGLVTKVDRAVLAMACEAWADWVEATKTLREEGRYYETDKGFRGQHPAASRMTTARMAFVALSAKLGLSPVDRVRLAMPVEREKTLDEMLG